MRVGIALLQAEETVFFSLFNDCILFKGSVQPSSNMNVFVIFCCFLRQNTGRMDAGAVAW